MKIRCVKNDLVSSISIVSKAVSSNKTSMSILECILIEVSNGIIKFTANDRELGIETKVKGEIDENGVVAIDANIFGNVVRSLPDGEVTISTDSSYKTTISCMKAKFDLPGRSGEDFSGLPLIEKNDMITISQYTLKEVIRQTIFAVSANDNNKLLTGELFDIKGDKLRVVSLDGHRGAIRNLELRQSYSDREVVIPGKTLSEISKILSGEIEKEVNIYFMSNHIVFEFDQTLMVSRVLDGEFFDVDRMLSKSVYATTVTVNKKDLQDTVERAILLIRDNDKKPVVIGISNESMEFKIKSNIGSMDEFVDCSKTGDDIIIGFNPKFLLDVLKVVDDENITMYMIDSKAPTIIKDETEKYIYVVLPINFATV